MQQLLNYRFTDGSLAGQSFGNLFLAAMNGISGSFDEAVHRMGDVLAITGRVLPVTNQDVRLEAEFHDGSRTLGESKIFYAKKSIIPASVRYALYRNARLLCRRVFGLSAMQILS